MNTLTITVPETITFKRAKQIVAVPTSGLSSEIITQLVMHGVTQKVGDAAAGKDGADALAAMDAVIAALTAGNWGRTRGSSAGEEPHVRFIRQIIRSALGEENKAKYKALADTDARDDFLMDLFDGLADEKQDAITDAAKKLHAEDVAQKLAAKNAIGAISIEL